MKDNMIILNDLDVRHPLRNTPLGEIDAKYKWKRASENVAWRTVQVGAPKIVNSTFNDLGMAWTEWDYWAVDEKK